LTLELTSEEARAIDLGHRWGLISRDSIRSIADQLIEASDITPSSEICELSICKRDFQINEVLSQFIGEFEKWSPVIILIKKYLRLSELDKDEKYSLYYSISNFADWDDPEPWRTFKIRCHELTDARQKIWGGEQSIAEEKSIARELSRILNSL